MWRGRREEEEQDAGANQRVNLGGQSEQRWRAAAAALGGAWLDALTRRD